MREFTSEDDLDTFEGWLKYQVVDTATITPEQLAMWRDYYAEGSKRDLATPKVGLMKLPPRIPGEYRYAVAVRDGSDLWLTMWVKRSPKPEYFVLIPRSDTEWDAHTSYHYDGTFHSKSFGHKAPLPRRQPLSEPFRGTEHLGVYQGHGPRGVGAICDPEAFSGVVVVEPGVLGPRDGGVLVDLIEPGCEPTSQFSFAHIVKQEIFRETVPWIVIRIGTGTWSPTPEQSANH